MLILIGTVTCMNLSAAFAAVRGHGLAVFGAGDRERLEEVRRLLNSGEGESPFYFCTPT